MEMEGSLKNLCEGSLKGRQTSFPPSGPALATPIRQLRTLATAAPQGGLALGGAIPGSKGGGGGGGSFLRVPFSGSLKGTQLG